jgi:preprotein translocase subunit SecE
VHAAFGRRDIVYETVAVIVISVVVGALIKVIDIVCVQGVHFLTNF